MTDAELIASLRTALAYHEAQAERYRRTLAILEDDGAMAPKARKAPKVKRSGEQRRPPSGGKGRARATPEEKARALKLWAETGDVHKAAKAVGVVPSSLYLWRAAAKKKSA